MIVQAGLDVLVLLSLAWLYEISYPVDISRLFLPDYLITTCLAISARLFFNSELFYTHTSPSLSSIVTCSKILMGLLQMLMS